MEDDEESPEEVAEVKAWLRDLRNKRKLTQAELASLMGVKERTVLNAESATSGLPRGLPFLRMLQALEVVSVFPRPAPTLSDRLATLEARVGLATDQATEALELLAARIDVLATRLEPPDEQATGGP